MSEELKSIIELLETDKVLSNEFAKKIIENNNINFKDINGKTALLYAVHKGYLHAVKKLVDLGADINEDTPSSNTILHIAAKNNYSEMVKYFLEEMKPPLSAELCGRTNMHGETALHAAAYAKSPEALKILLENDFFKNKINDENYYGWKALDIASGFQNDDSVKILSGNKNLTDEELEKLPHYGQPLKDISQEILNEKLIKYLTITGRDGAKIMDSEGYCNGWAFLYQISKNKNEFFEILNLLENWDGTDESLKKTKPPKHLEEKYKKIFPDKTEELGSLSDVFEQLANDIILFQMYSEATNELGLNINQDDRIKQFKISRNKSDNRELEHLFFLDAKLNKAQLIEILELLSRYRGTSIDISGEAHGTALHVTDERNFVLDYYDPNSKNRLKPFVSTESLADYIIKLKYKLIVENYKPSEPIYITFSIFKIYNNSKNIPNTEKASPPSKPMNHSANKFSELHYAVMENDTDKVKKLLLNTEQNNIYAEDAHGISVLKRALSMGNHEIINCFIEAKAINFDTLIDSIYWKNVKIERVIEIIFKKINKSEASEFEKKILERALQTNHLDLINILLDRGFLINNDNLINDAHIEALIHNSTNPYELMKFFNNKNNRLDLSKSKNILGKVIFNQYVGKLVKKNDTNIIGLILKLIDNGAELDPTNVSILCEIFSNETLAETYKKCALKNANHYDFSKFFDPFTNLMLNGRKERLNIMNFLLEMGADLAGADYLSLVETIEFHRKNPSNPSIEEKLLEQLAIKIRWGLKLLNLTNLKKLLSGVPELAKTTVIPLIIKYLNDAEPGEKIKLVDAFKKSANESLIKIANELDAPPITYGFSSRASTNDEKNHEVKSGPGQNIPHK